MIVLVAGGTGFLGSKVVEILETEGHKVIIHNRNNKTVPTYADVIINCAGILREGRQGFKKVHVEKTRWLLKLGQKLGVKQFVQVSAIGADLDGTLYQKTKRQAEILVENSGINYAIIRPSIIAGPGKSATEMFRSIARTGIFPVFANGKVQPVHRDTVAKLIVASANRRIRNRIVEVGGPEIFTYRSLAKRLHPGVMTLKVPKILGRVITFIGALIPPLPTKDMVKMLAQDNVTSDKTVYKLRIPNPRIR